MTKKTKRIAVFTSLVAVVLFLSLGLWSTNDFEPMRGDVVKITQSPDKSVNMVMTRERHEGTSNITMRVYINANLLDGHAHPNLVFEAEQVDDLTTKWGAEKEMIISYKDAQVLKMQRTVYPLGKSKNASDGYLVRVK